MLQSRAPAIMITSEDGRRNYYSMQELEKPLGQVELVIKGRLNQKVININTKLYRYPRWSHNAHKGGNDSSWSSVLKKYGAVTEII